MVEVGEDVSTKLLAEYSMSIDTSTLLAILSDYDLSNSAELSEARATLDILRDSIPDDERMGFDPSATAGNGLSIDKEGSAGVDEESVSARSLPGWASQTDDTSLNQDLSSLDLEGSEIHEHNKSSSYEVGERSSYTSELDNLDKVEKEAALVGIFPALKPFDIKWTLKKCKWDASLAIDELMTQSFLEEIGTRHRGIEAFSENDAAPKSRKSKGKKRKAQLTDQALFDSMDAVPMQSKWHTGMQDVEFLSEKTNMPVKQISSIYHENGASVRATIRAIIEAHQALILDVDDPIIQINASELQESFPALSTTDLTTLIQITHPSIGDARDLAKALLSRSSSFPATGIQIEFRNRPVEDDTESFRIKPKAHNAVFHDDTLDYALAKYGADTLHEAQYAAKTQANNAYRKGKSDHLMGGAAAYYSQVARDLGDRARILDSAAADALVAKQSSMTELDLHGVNVKDALRISSERVNTWWHALGESRINGRGGIGSAYRIVTGLGKHSESGIGKLGPAVGKMLIREGWKVEVGSGVLVVTDVAKKR